MITYIFYKASYTDTLIAQKNNRVCALILGDDRNKMLKELYTDFNNEVFTEKNERTNIDNVVISTIENPKSQHFIPIHFTGTELQVKIWEQIKTIPAGQVKSYSDIAKDIGLPKTSRAVANACAANKIAILIPCHRVVKKGGALSGFRWGDNVRHAIMKLEK